MLSNMLGKIFSHIILNYLDYLTVCPARLKIKNLPKLAQMSFYFEAILWRFLRGMLSNMLGKIFSHIILNYLDYLTVSPARLKIKNLPKLAQMSIYFKAILWRFSR